MREKNKLRISPTKIAQPVLRELTKREALAHCEEHRFEKGRSCMLEQRQQQEFLACVAAALRNSNDNRIIPPHRGTPAVPTDVAAILSSLALGKNLCSVAGLE